LRAKRNPRLGECTKNDHVVPKFTDRTPHLPREIVLGRIASVVKKFVYKISIARGLSEAAANAAGGKIYTFGSYRLGVHGPGSDIDTLCVVPKHVNREDFFEVFEGMLKDVEGVTEVSVSSSLYFESPRMC
jgi:poly(A) polymerase Pap1